MNATSQALEELKKVLNSEENPLTGIRIFTQQGCCGPSVQMSVSDHALNDDKIITIGSINFFIASSAEEMMSGVTLDFGPGGFKLEGMKRNGSGCCG